MSRKFHFLLLASFSLLILASCRKDGHGRNENKTEMLNVSVDAGTLYELSLVPYGGPNSTAAISKQAVSYATSTIIRNNSGENIYRFLKEGSPKTGGNGTDQVVLKVSGESGRCGNRETTITINFTIR